MKYATQIIIYMTIDWLVEQFMSKYVKIPQKMTFL